MQPKNVREKKVDEFFKAFKTYRKVGQEHKKQLSPPNLESFPKKVQSDPGYAGLLINKLYMDYFGRLSTTLLDQHGPSFFKYGKKEVEKLISNMLEKSDDETTTKLNSYIKKIATKHFSDELIKGKEDYHNKLRFFLYILTNYGPVLFEGNKYHSIVHPISIGKIKEFIENNHENRMEESDEGEYLKIAIPIKANERERCLLADYDKEYGIVNLWLIKKRSEVPKGFEHLVENFELRK